MNDNNHNLVKQAATPRVPPLRFPDFSEPWVEKRLGDVLDINYGRDHQSLNEGEIPVFGSGGIMRFVNQKLSDGPCVLIGRKGTIDTPIFVNVPFWAVDTMFYSDIKRGFDPFFAYLTACRVRWLRYAEATGVPSLTKTTIEAIPVKVSREIDEQRKIADFLGAVDRWVAALRARRDALATYKSGVMQQIFSQKIRFTQPDGTPFPDWQEKRLGDVFEWISTNSLPRVAMTDNGGKIQNVHYGDIHIKFSNTLDQDKDQIPFVLEEALVPFPKREHFCKVGDVIFADASEDTADIGKAIEIMNVRDGSLLAGLHTLLARPIETPQSHGFFGQMFAAPQFRERIGRIAQGISVLGISKTNLEQLAIKIPHPDEQQKIADFLGAINRRIDAATRQITTATTFKHALLQQMFI